MEIILPNNKQVAQINQSRLREAGHMSSAGTLEGPLMIKAGLCAADSNRHRGGELAMVRHVKTLARAAAVLAGIDFDARLNGVKPRTRGGTTGLIHQAGGPRVYGEAASLLTTLGISLVAEVMDESDAAVAGPWLSAKWGGARNLEDCGVRHLLRPTEEDQERGVVPAPAYVKSDAYGRMDIVLNALHTIRSEKPETRTRFTLDGLRQVVTLGNPHTGLILRGHEPRPSGPIDEILGEEILNAREHMDSEFGKGQIPVLADTSHRHAKWEGGGEAGQLAIAASLIRLMDQGIIIDGVMMETYLLPGKQPDTGTVPGLSQVDECVRQINAIQILQALNDARTRQLLSVPTPR